MNVAEINEVNSTPDHEEKKESLDEEIPMNVDDKVAFAEGFKYKLSFNPGCEYY